MCGICMIIMNTQKLGICRIMNIQTLQQSRHCTLTVQLAKQSFCDVRGRPNLVSFIVHGSSESLWQSGEEFMLRVGYEGNHVTVGTALPYPTHHMFC